MSSVDKVKHVMGSKEPIEKQQGQTLENVQPSPNRFVDVENNDSSSNQDEKNLRPAGDSSVNTSKVAVETTAPIIESTPATKTTGEAPVTTETTTSNPFEGLSFQVGVAENKNVNYRATMEDVHTYVANFAERLDWGYFAIFDGHAGKQTARWCGNNLHSLLEQEIVSEPSEGEVDLRESMCKAFVKADELISKEPTGNSGCTAAVAVLRWEELSSTDLKSSSAESSKNLPLDNETSKSFDFVPSNHRRMLYTSNVGDSRIILCRKGQPYRLSYDHKASDRHEIARIRDAGGLIMKNRVNGVLAVTRSLGDSYMKELVIGKPYTTATEIVVDDEFMILACDGLWDVVSDLHAVQFVSKALNDGLTVSQAAKKLCQLAMDNSTTDNVTIMVVKFDQSVFALGHAVQKLGLSS
ncbi:hypothetical protein CAAN1_07S06634 [[Candida] anglica]|uniref:PPM-type phosphatase domain-containing protein n=1 Tax=[Candida] anglica TaxID=148631 RepID=A0ABP0EEC9_9ASCO